MMSECRAGYPIPDDGGPCAHCGATENDECLSGAPNATVVRLIAERDDLRAKLAQAVDPERVARGLLLLKIEEAIADGGPSRGADWLADMRTKMGAASHDELRGMVAGLLKTKGARS